ncbi:unnamed protein product [Gadus morhua 'NCC']
MGLRVEDTHIYWRHTVSPEGPWEAGSVGAEDATRGRSTRDHAVGAVHLFGRAVAVLRAVRSSPSAGLERRDYRVLVGSEPSSRRGPH